MRNKLKPINDNPFDIYGAGTEPKSETLKLFSDELLSLKGSILELYIGDVCETMNYDEISVPQCSSIFGELIDVFDRFVVLKCLYLDNNNNLQHGNKVYINAFQIRAMTILDGKGSLNDIFLNIKDAAYIRNILKNKVI